MEENETEAQGWGKALLLLVAVCWFITLVYYVSRWLTD